MFAAKIKVAVCLLLFATATNAGAAPPPPPGCGLYCGTITLIKDPSAGVPFVGPEAALGPPWVSYQLDLHTPTSGSRGLAVQVVINGQLHQRWLDSNGDGVFEPSANDADSTGGDSHLLAAAGTQFPSAPVEDNSGIGSPLVDTLTNDYGVGTTLQGTWGTLSASGFTTLAYVVVPKASPLDIAVQWVFSDDQQGTLRTSDFIWIPEPGTGVLAVLAILGLASFARHR